MMEVHVTSLLYLYLEQWFSNFLHWGLLFRMSICLGPTRIEVMAQSTIVVTPESAAFWRKLQ